MGVLIMGNIYDEINSVIMESSLSVLDAMMSIIDKNDMINEYSENEEFSDVFLESMMIFMEASKDVKQSKDIRKWMESKGYWYTGDNPKKKKECNRMYHFLQQHKFDPKTETYESDIDDGKGGKKRIKLNIDRVETEDPEFKRSVLKGENAFHRTSKADITVGSKMLKKKQADSQFVLKHEEGHENSRVVNNGERYSNYGNPVRDFIDDYKGDWDNEKFVNDHDDSVEELKADEYGAKHTKIRTKNAGKQGKRAVRDLKTRDMLKIFMKMSDIHLKNGIDAAESLRSRKEKFEKKIDDYNKTKDRLSKMKGHVSKSDIDFINDMIDDKNVGSAFHGDIRFYHNMAQSIDHVVKYRKELTDWQSKITEIEQKLNQDGINMFEELNLKFRIEHLKKNIENASEPIERGIKRIQKDIQYMKNNNKTFDTKLVKGLRGSDLDDDRVQDKLGKMIDKCCDSLDSVIKTNKDIIKDTDDIIKQIKLVNDEGMEFSTALRYKYAKQFVKEYFEELFDEYIYCD